VHRSAAYPAERPPQTSTPADEVVMDVRDRDDVVAQIRLDVERPLTADQWQLANDLAQQAAMALRNARLEAELADRVEQLVAQTAELETSRRGLVAARDDERHRLADALQEAVVAHLESMPADLASLAATVVTDPAGAETRVALHIESAGSALTELRTISRGLRPQPTPRPAVLDRTPPS
jgi:GAF domain-containing protein